MKVWYIYLYTKVKKIIWGNRVYEGLKRQTQKLLTWFFIFIYMPYVILSSRKLKFYYKTHQHSKHACKSMCFGNAYHFSSVILLFHWIEKQSGCGRALEHFESSGNEIVKKRCKMLKMSLFTYSIQWYLCCQVTTLAKNLRLTFWN